MLGTGCWDLRILGREDAEDRGSWGERMLGPKDALDRLLGTEGAGDKECLGT